MMGRPGERGVAGTPGLPGRDGYPGTVGPDGNPGTDGIPGQPGEPGRDGMVRSSLVFLDVGIIGLLYRNQLFLRFSTN